MPRAVKSARQMKKVRHDRDFDLRHGDNRWIIDMAEWRDQNDPSYGELRVYTIHGSITDPALVEGLELEAASRSLANIINQPMAA